jgi:hypothetical protein
MGRSKQAKPIRNTRSNESEWGRWNQEGGHDHAYTPHTRNDTAAGFSYFRATVVEEDVPTIEVVSRRALEKRNEEEEEEQNKCQDLVDSEEDEEEQVLNRDDRRRKLCNGQNRRTRKNGDNCISVDDVSSETDSKLLEVEIVKCKRKKCDTIFKVQQEACNVGQMDSKCDGWIIQTFILERAVIEIEQSSEQATNDGMQMMKSRFSCPRITIPTPKIAIKVLNLYTKSKSQKFKWDGLIPALEYKLLQVEIQQQQMSPSSSENLSVVVRILLTKKAYDCCSPNVLPRSVPLRRPKSKKKMDCRHYAFMIQESFPLLFQSTCLDVLLSSSSSSSLYCSSVVHKNRKSDEQKITAKCVYKAVDNVHSYRFEKENNSIEMEEKTPLDESDQSKRHPRIDALENIPGLVPKLREYQKAAVQWMLEREHGQYDNRGWEICWVAIRCSNRDNDNDSFQYFDAGEKDHILPLYKWKASGDTNYLFYNPFTGWLVDSYDGAKLSTVGSGDPVRGGILAESMGLGKCMQSSKCESYVLGFVNRAKSHFLPFYFQEKPWKF